MDQSTGQPRETPAKAVVTIPLRSGDVRALQVIVTDGQIVIAVSDEADDGRPLIQAVLDQNEQASLVHALIGPGGGDTTSGVGAVPRTSATPAGSCRTRGRA